MKSKPIGGDKESGTPAGIAIPLRFIAEGFRFGPFSAALRNRTRWVLIPARKLWR
jgi:hypothetical protein